MKRIFRDFDNEEIVQQLSGEGGIFRHIWQVLLFSAALGITKNKKRQLDNPDPGKALMESVFSATNWKGFIYLMSLVETGDSDCLRAKEEEQNEMIKNFEEYANSGLHYLNRRISDTNNDDLDLFIEMLMNVDATINVEDEQI